MSYAKFPCPHCGAAKKTIGGLCPKCMRFGTAKGYCPVCSEKEPSHDRSCHKGRAALAASGEE